MTGTVDTRDRAVLQSALADLAEVSATSRWVRSGALRLHVLDYGGDGVPLVVLPGITSPAISMDFLARELTDLVRPVVLDIRGRGLSDPGSSYTLEDYAQDTVELITQLGLRRPLLLGHSMGARITAVVAAGDTPLRGTVLVDPPMSGPGRSPYPVPLQALLNQLHEAQRGTTADEVAKAWGRWPRREQELRARWLSSCDETAVADSHHGFHTEDFFPTWSAVPCPTVLVHGGDSPVVTPEGLAEAKAGNPEARYVEVPDSGHMLFWDQPENSIALLRQELSILLA